MDPVSVNIDINNQCNLSCEYCRVEKGDSQMGFGLFKSIVEQHKETKLFGIGGGEPMFHADLALMIEYLLEIDKSVNLSTNLTMDPGILKESYGDNGQFTLQVNLPASNDRLYERITRSRFFSQVVSHLQRVKHCFTTLVSGVVYKGNFEDVPSLIDFSVAGIGVPIRVNLGYPVGNARNLEILSMEEVLKLTSIIQAKRVEYPGMIYSSLRFTDSTCRQATIPCSYNAHFFEGGVQEVSVEGRGCCYDKLYYDPNGRAFRCEFMDDRSLMECRL